MTRIFLTLSTLSLVLMCVALSLGLSMGDFNGAAQEAIDKRQPPDPDLMNWSVIHKMTGVAAALSVVFVNSIVVTYFVGTSRWCKEVVETYQLDRSFIQRSAALKHRTFPWAVMGMLAVVVVIALGGASDPSSGNVIEGTRQLATAAWVNYHLVGSFAGIAFVGWVYFVCWNNIYANHELIREILALVHKTRTEKGLDTEDTPVGV